METHSNILAWEIPQRGLAGYSSWSYKESDTTGLLIPLTPSLFLNEFKIQMLTRILVNTDIPPRNYKKAEKVPGPMPTWYKHSLIS